MDTGKGNETYVPPEAARTRSLFDELADAGPDFRTAIEDELANDAPDFLPHIVMARVTDCAIELAERADPPADAQVRRLLGVLERWFAAGEDSDPPVNVIGVSFLEHLGTEAGYPNLRLRELAADYPSLDNDLRRYWDD